MRYYYNKLIGKIVEKFGTQIMFAKAIELSERSLSLKLNGRVGFKQNEITKACILLGISDEEIPEYFFCLISSI